MTQTNSTTNASAATTAQWQGQPAYTPQQVLNNLGQIRDMLAGDYGERAQWIRFVCNDIRARGIAINQD